MYLELGLPCRKGAVSLSLASRLPKILGASASQAISGRHNTVAISQHRWDRDRIL